MQLLHPEVAYSYEVDPEMARRSRERMLERGDASRLYVAASHLTEPFTVR
jgi:hypothetical protein